MAVSGVNSKSNTLQEKSTALHCTVAGQSSAPKDTASQPAGAGLYWLQFEEAKHRLRSHASSKQL